MYINLQDEKIELTSEGIATGQDTLSLTLVSDKSLDDIETLFNQDTSKLSIVDENDTEVNFFKGYTKLLSVAKDTINQTIIVTLGQPSITIRGLSNLEEVKAILESQGYTVEG